MKRRIVATATALLLPPALALAGGGGQDIRTLVEEMQKQIKAQQEQIYYLNSLIDAPADNTDAKGKTPAGVVKVANKHIDQLKLKADLRIRFEQRDRDKPAPAADDARDRFRTRVRVGGIWQNKSENWEVGVGVATGGNDGTSTNDTWSETNIFETGDLRLDYAYARHTLNDNFTLIFGQQKNPFVSSWLLWDGDLRPTGFTAQYASNGLFGTVGAYDVYQAGNDLAMLGAGQIGYKGKSGDAKFKVAAALYNYDTKVFNLITRPNPNYEYRLGDIYGEVKLPAGGAKWTFYGQAFQNFGAEGAAGQGVMGGTLDPNSENLGWVVGCKAKVDKLKLGYAYAEVGADSVIGVLKDADFGTGVNNTDVKGHKISASYSVSKNYSVGATALLYEAKELPNQNKANLYQVDFKYKF